MIFYFDVSLPLILTCDWKWAEENILHFTKRTQNKNKIVQWRLLAKFRCFRTALKNHLYLALISITFSYFCTIFHVCFKHFMQYLLLKIQDRFRSTILIFYVSTMQTLLCTTSLNTIKTVAQTSLKNWTNEVKNEKTAKVEEDHCIKWLFCILHPRVKKTKIIL